MTDLARDVVALQAEVVRLREALEGQMVLARRAREKLGAVTMAGVVVPSAPQVAARLVEEADELLVEVASLGWGVLTDDRTEGEVVGGR